MEHKMMRSRFVTLGVTASASMLLLSGCATHAMVSTHPGASSQIAVKGSVGSAPLLSGIKGFRSTAGFHAADVTAAPLSCSMVAVPSSVPAANAVPSGSYPPGEPPAAGIAAPTQSAVLTAAYAAAASFNGAAAAATSPTAIVQESYSAYMTASGQTDNNPQIDPTRCVWVTVVNSPISISHPPASAGEAPENITESQYSVVIDAATGFLVELHATP
jgi:hypothetical protein